MEELTNKQIDFLEEQAREKHYEEKENERMKKFKCPNCKKETEVNGDTITVLCGCGYYMVEQISGGEDE